MFFIQVHRRLNPHGLVRYRLINMVNQLIESPTLRVLMSSSETQDKEEEFIDSCY